MKNPNSVFNGNAHVIKQGGSDSEVILCFSTKFEASADLTVTGLGFNFRHCH